jgi:hypothetical protein
MKSPSKTVTIAKFTQSGKPTEVVNAFWIAANYSGKMKKATARTGKWLMFVAEKYADNTWENVRNAVEAGSLWKTAKISTALGRERGYVLCVYTYDYEDVDDVMRIRETLRQLGFKRPISYKTDEQTADGAYSDSVAGIAKYQA